MTEHTDINLAQDIINPILDHGLEGLPDAISLLVNHAMRVERSHHLSAAPYQRVPARTGHANGFKDRHLDTRIGTLEPRVPQVRNAAAPFFPSALERGQRSEKALTLAIAEPSGAR